MFWTSLKRKLLWSLILLPCSGYFRARLARTAGVTMRRNPGERWDIFLGNSVQLDSMHPEDIEIGNWTTIATGKVILTHFLEPDVAPFPFFSHARGKVKIGRGCFIGANCVICKPVTIADGSVVAAGSVILKNIPPMEIWGGNPARFLKNE